MQDPCKGHGVNVASIIAEIAAIIEQAGDTHGMWYKETELCTTGKQNENENEKVKLLHSILQHAPDDTLEQIRKAVTEEERVVLDHLLDALRTKTGRHFCHRVDSDEVIDEVGDMLDLSAADTTFYEILIIYIMEAGYRKVSDFYTKLNIERRYWARYKKGFIPPKRKIVEMIIFLQLDYEDAEYLLNVAGMSFQKNATSDLIITYFLQHDYPKHMPPEALLVLIDEVLENFNQEPLHSER